MSINTRLSRDAEIRLFKLAHSYRICYPYGAKYGHIHEKEFEEFLAGEGRVHIEYDMANWDGSFDLAEDRVVVFIDDIHVYDTGKQDKPSLKEQGDEHDRGELVSESWFDMEGRLCKLRKHRDGRYHFCIPESIKLVTALTLVREVGMPSTYSKAFEMIKMGRVLLDGKQIFDVNLVLEHGFGAKLSLREWQESHSVRVLVIYGVKEGSEPVPTVAGVA